MGYRKTKKSSKIKFEVVYVSFDKDEAEFKEFVNTVPFKAIDFESAKRKGLGDWYDIRKIPC